MAQCYDWNSETQVVGTLPTDIWIQCPSGNTCCVGGSVCLDHNLCHVPGSSSTTSGSFSSYYVARCSDPTYTSADCQKVCDAPGPPDAVYNYTSQQWNCCGKDDEGNVSCNNPTPEIFQAPAPADLSELLSDVAIVSTATLAAGGKSSTTSSPSSDSTSLSPSPSSSTGTTQATSSSSTSSTSSNASQAPSPNSAANISANSASSSGSMSIGAKAGIGIGVALAIIAVLLLALFFLRRLRKKRAQAGMTVDPDTDNSYGYLPEKGVVQAQAAPVVLEKGTDADLRGYENGYGPRSELGSSNELVSGRVHEMGDSR